MTKSYYDLLDVAPVAPAEEIKRAFRREIAKYHPDKVQHLGPEFQEIAAVKAAELTQAYKTLSDVTLRAEYDAQLESPQTAAKLSSPPTAAEAPVVPPPAAASPSPHSARDREPDVSSTGNASSLFSQERAGANELVRRATVMRFRQALQGEFETFEDVAVPGFDVTCVPKPAFFSRNSAPRVLGRFVDRVDRISLAEAWGNAARIKKDNERDVVIFLMGPEVAPATELAAAITEQRRKARTAGGKLFVVPVNTRNWHAHIPADAPPVVKSLTARLKSL